MGRKECHRHSHSTAGITYRINFRTKTVSWLSSSVLLSRYYQALNRSGKYHYCHEPYWSLYWLMSHPNSFLFQRILSMLPDSFALFICPRHFITSLSCTQSIYYLVIYSATHTLITLALSTFTTWPYHLSTHSFILPSSFPHHTIFLLPHSLPDQSSLCMPQKVHFHNFHPRFIIPIPRQCLTTIK